eukprot:1386468-Pleurochrysis_carterae.AAC.1
MRVHARTFAFALTRKRAHAPVRLSNRLPKPSHRRTSAPSSPRCRYSFTTRRADALCLEWPIWFGRNESREVESRIGERESDTRALLCSWLVVAGKWDWLRRRR